MCFVTSLSSNVELVGGSWMRKKETKAGRLAGAAFYSARVSTANRGIHNQDEMR